MLIEDVNDLLGLEIEDEEVDSIGGWLFNHLEGNISKGQKVLHENYVFEIAQTERLRVQRVHIYKNKQVIPMVSAQDSQLGKNTE
jgi:CBS domain containing-hemolysin-like protein